MMPTQALERIAIKNILFATDFSPAANAAVPFAKQIARKFGAKTIGVYVSPYDSYVAAAPEAWAALAEAANRDAKLSAQRLNEQLAGVEHEAVIAEGNVWEVVSGLIKDKWIDLIILGTRGRTGLGKNLMGSVAEEILRKALCPVLTVGPHVTLQPENAANLHEILYATDLTLELPPAASYAISLAQENQARLTLLHVIEDQKTGEFVHPSEIAQFKLQKLDELVPKEAELWCEPKCLVEKGEAAQKILEVAQKHSADLIVLGAQPAKWLSTHLNISTVHQVVAEAPCPVLTVRG